MSKDAAESSNPYKDTLFLPKTEFPMRGGLPQQEPARLKSWEESRLYEQLRADAKGRPAFMLHDGPPYANGHIHIGTGMNKILKDIVVRSRQMTGYDADYIPGWDCHGLPIEWKVEEAYRADNRQKRDVPAGEFRAACRAYAEGWIDVQREEFKRLGVMGDWDNPYLTMAYASEAATVKEFLKVAMSGQLKRGAKPVMWSPVEQTALAEAEIEYEDRKATTIWVKFPWNGLKLGQQILDRKNLDGASFVIWTTTPWTIPANRAVSFNPTIEYGLFVVDELENDLAFAPWAASGDKFVLAKKLADGVMKAAKVAKHTFLRDIHPEEMWGCLHPLRESNLGGYKFDVPLLPGDHVSGETGTGFVHTAPGHGEDDYNVWIATGHKNTDIPNTVDAFGRYTSECPGFEGLEIIRLDGKKRGEDGPANRAVVDKLIESGNLLARGTTTLRDAHSWRSKAPVIRRATPQWFIAMDETDAGGKTLRDKALAAIDATAFTPERGRERLRSMVEDRPDWLISRQRAWGVPLTLFVHRQTAQILKDDAVNARIVEAVRKGGADAWFSADAQTFLGEGHNPDDYDKINDILDVWFDSGTTHAFTLEDRGKKWPADVYLEGSDQHRGWFQSSLLESCATRGRAPYDAIMTHGFVQAEDGRKMSKSLGNTISPQEVCDKFGADILRIWVAFSDYTDDPSFGPDIIAANVETYRKLRNTMRYLLGAVDGFAPAEAVARDDMPSLEQWVLHRLAELDLLVRTSQAAYDFKGGFHALLNFCAVDLSAVYFDIRKDALYCDAPSSLRRRAVRTVMDEVLSRLIAWFAPVMVFTCEEAWEHRHPGTASVHLRQYPATPEGWLDPDVAAKWERIFTVRKAVTGALEVERREKRIGSSLEARVDVAIADLVFLDAFEDEDPADIFITSEASLGSGAQSEDGTSMSLAAGQILVATSRASGVKCARSWKYFDPGSADPQFPDITLRDAVAVREFRGMTPLAPLGEG
ncbi:MAG: isoleucine--tRNA ligase [Alphaproteobacteria bacterium]|nr:isoleucine--tRNA ligase [Alphaproteobacteria bacterium]